MKFRNLQESYNQLTVEYNSLKSTNQMLTSEYENSKKHLLEYEQRYVLENI